MGALQINKKTELPPLSVRGNDYQAGNISLPAPGAPVTTPMISVGGNTSYYKSPQGPSWNTPSPGPTPIQQFINVGSQMPILGPAFKGLTDIPRDINDGPIAQGIRLGVAKATHNPVAAQNARTRIQRANQKLNQKVKDPMFLAQAFMDGGVGKAGKPIELPGKPGKAVGKNAKKPNVPTVHLTVEGGKQAEFPAKYYRIGRPPENQNSINHVTGKPEGGVSVFKGYEGPNGKITVDALHDKNELAQGKKMYEVTGVPHQYGSDDESLLKPGSVKIVKEVDPKKVVPDNNPDYNYHGEDVSLDYPTFHKPVTQPAPGAKTPPKGKSLPKAPISEIDQRLQESILGQKAAPQYKDSQLGQLAEKLSINKQARKLTQPVEGVVNKGIRSSLESGKTIVRTPGRTAVGISRQAGRTPEEIARLAEYHGSKVLGDIYGKDIAASGDKAVKQQGIRKEAVHEILDPELYKAKGKTITDHTPEEVAAADKLREVNQIIHEGNHSLGLIDDATFKKNDGQYIARNADDYFKDEASYHIAKDNKLDLNIFKGRKELDKIPDKVVKAMDEDPFFLTAMRSQQFQRNKSFIEYSDWLANHGSTLDKPKKGYIQVPESPVYGSLKGKYVLKEQLEDLQGFIYETTNAQHAVALMNAYDRFAPRKARKSVLTIYNPGVRIGNRTFNYLVSSLNGINPITFTKNYARGRKMMKTNSSEYIEATKAGVFSPSIIDKELYRSGDLQPKGGVLKQAHNKAADTYSAVDNEAKMAAYLTFRERGVPSAEAATRTRRMLQNYDMVGHLFDQGAKIPVFGNAFVRFSSELMRIAHNTAVDNPIRAASAAVAATTLITMASKASGESPEDRKTREGRLGAPRVPFTNQSLEVQTPWGAVNAGRLLGITTYNDLTGGVQEDAKRLMPFQSPVTKDSNGYHLNAQAAGSDPLIGPLVSLGVNRDFRGKNIADPEAAKYPSQPLPSNEQNKNRAKYGAMSYVPLANEIDSVKSAIQHKPNYYGKERSTTQAALRVGGIKIEKYGKDQAQKQRETDAYFNDKATIDNIAKQLPSKEAQDVFKKYTSNEKISGHEQTKIVNGQKITVNNDRLVKKGIYDTATKAQEMIKYPEVFDALKKKAQLDSKRTGLPMDPVFSLPRDRRTAFFNIQIANNTSPGSPESKKLKQDAKDWYFDFAQKRTDYLMKPLNITRKKALPNH
jgi:hypothetical protein